MKIWVSALFPSTLYVALNLESTLGRRSLKGGQEVPAMCFDCSDSAVEPEFGLSVEIQIEVFMGYEVDFLPVGNGEKSGDAIAVRFGDLLSRDPAKQFVMVIDGGTKESGQRLVNHINAYYGTSHVDLVVNTHPDGDHASGLAVVLEQMSVGQLWVHLPWEHSEDIHHMFHDGRITPGSLSDRMRDALENAKTLETIAAEKGIPIVEPFAGVGGNIFGGTVRVLGPDMAYYQSLLPDFRSTPEKRLAASFNEMMMKAAFNAAGGVATLTQRVKEAFGIETLEDPDDDATSAENNSSVILCLQVDGKQLLFTGDAGVPALERADQWAIVNGITLADSCFQQVPHHGSRRNIGPSILDRILGLKRRYDVPDKTAFVSAAKGAPKHPSKKVTNAYRRRGANVVTTEGVAIWHKSNDVPQRPNYVAADILPLYPEVEED